MLRLGKATERGNFLRTKSQTIEERPYEKKPAKTLGERMVEIKLLKLKLISLCASPDFKNNWPTTPKNILEKSKRYLFIVLYFS